MQQKTVSEERKLQFSFSVGITISKIHVSIATVPLRNILTSKTGKTLQLRKFNFGICGLNEERAAVKHFTAVTTLDSGELIILHVKILCPA